MTNINHDSGPFGNYALPSAGRLLNFLCRQERVPLSTVEKLQIVPKSEAYAMDTITYNGNVVAHYKWIEETHVPIFRWVHPEFAIYNKQRWMVDEDNNLLPDLRLQLGPHGNAALIIEGLEATPEVNQYLRYPMLTNYMDHACYTIHKDAGAFFQGGAHDPDGKWFYIEFWNEKKAQAFVDYFNQHFRFEEDPRG